MIVNLKCPNCGAQMEVEEGTETVFCQFCGAKVSNMAEKVNINQTITVIHKYEDEPKKKNSSDANLLISYSSINAGVLMVVRIVSTGQKMTGFNGQTLSFKLPPGFQQIIIKIGKVNYSRNIVIPDDGEPVRINASFTGHANISVSPNGMSASAPSQAYTDSVINGAGAPLVPGVRKSPLSIVAFVLSFLYYTSPIAVVLGIVDLFALRKKNMSHGLSVAAIIIGALMTILMISTMAAYCSSVSSLSSYGYY